VKNQFFILLLVVFAGCSANSDISSFSKRKYTKGFFNDIPAEKLSVASNATGNFNGVSIPKVEARNQQIRPAFSTVQKTDYPTVLPVKEPKLYSSVKEFNRTINNDIVADTNKKGSKATTDADFDKGKKLMQGSAIASLCTFIFPLAIIVSLVFVIEGFDLIPRVLQPKSNIGTIALVCAIVSFALAILAGIFLIPAAFPVIFSLYATYIGLSAAILSFASLVLSIISLHKEGDDIKSAAVAILLFPCEVIAAILVILFVNSKVI